LIKVVKNKWVQIRKFIVIKSYREIIRKLVRNWFCAGAESPPSARRTSALNGKAFQPKLQGELWIYVNGQAAFTGGGVVARLVGKPVKAGIEGGGWWL
jgi:hypothetical protein